MKVQRLLIILGLITVFILCNVALAASTSTQTVTFQVTAINEIAASGNPAPLIVNSATAGSQPAAAINSATTYAITTNEANKKITGVLDSGMPAGTTLIINLAAPTGASSAGDVVLTNIASDLVTGITKIAESGKTITYAFSANIDAGVIASSTRTVTLTITN